MSAYKWLSFAIGIPLLAVMTALIYEFAYPAVDLATQYSSSSASATGLQWYEQFLTWLPFVLLMLLAFMVIVAIITRRRSVVR